LSWEVRVALRGRLHGVCGRPAIDVKEGETVAVSAAAGGVGTVVVQLLALHKAAVVGIASPDNAEWLIAHGAVQVSYGEGLAERLLAAAPNGIDAFIDLFGPSTCSSRPTSGSLPTASRPSSPTRRQPRSGKGKGQRGRLHTEVLTEMADLVASGAIEIPIARPIPWTRWLTPSNSSNSATPAERSS